MTTFESKIEKAKCGSEKIFQLLSDLNNVEKFKHLIPSDKIKDIEYGEDFCRFSVDPVGQVGLKIIEREEFKTIKFAAEKSPVEFNLWIQLKEVGEDDTRVKITVKADLNPMIKMMVSKHIEGFVDKFAGMIAQLPYKQL